ncbi:MAG: hypothetical protein V3W41_22245 [Planctomycetota bacterium]
MDDFEHPTVKRCRRPYAGHPDTSDETDEEFIARLKKQIAEMKERKRKGDHEDQRLED